ncbi:tyrosine-type recombinase/integrase [Hippea maritima]|uniref:Integrase family protein n=1 Tax=Hippea maritima (strain ATCC 700847 / DSM 10411 / MH2) TaxID=760142 RepID=F2LV81_HIPMA|nr:tyrosine-type recombinase/integrase [Hippea maritima]AEA33665.1 integrase family protein [Hippea maritima DSM 10411]
MAIYIVCPNCRMEYSAKKKSCPKCGYVVKQNKTFRISVSFHGKRVRQTVSGTNLQGAKEIEAKIKSELVSGEYYDRRQAKIAFEQFVKEKYLPYAKEKKSYNREESLLRLWIFPIIDKKTLNNISPLDIEKVKKEMIKNEKAPRTIEYAIAVMRQVFNKAIEWGFYFGANPAAKVKKPKKDNRRMRFLTKEEAEKLLSELKKHSIQVYEMAYLSLYTGMRFGEIANLTWQDIDFQNGIITIKDPKNSESRVAYMTDSLRDLLYAKYKREKPKNSSGFVFHRNGKPYKQIPGTFKTVVRKLGLNDGITDPRDKVVFHTLRHTFASWLAIQGTPIYTIKELMGHKTLAMTERYSHLIPDAKREAVEKLFGNT